MTLSFVPQADRDTWPLSRLQPYAKEREACTAADQVRQDPPASMAEFRLDRVPASWQKDGESEIAGHGRRAELPTQARVTGRRR